MLDLGQDDRIVLDHHRELVALGKLKVTESEMLQIELDLVVLVDLWSGRTLHVHGKFATDSGAGGGRGASAIGDWSPNTWELSFQKKDKQYSLQHNKARNFTIQDKLTLELLNLRFRSVGSKKIANEIQYVTTALQNLGGKVTSKDKFKAEVQAVHENNYSFCESKFEQSFGNLIFQPQIAFVPTGGFGRPNHSIADDNII